jgi:hypothetical protein
MELLETPMILAIMGVLWTLPRFVVAMLCAATAKKHPAAHKRHLRTLELLTRQKSFLNRIGK